MADHPMQRRGWPAGIVPALLILAIPVLLHVPFWLAGLHEDPIWVTSSLVMPHRGPLVPGLAGYLDLNAGWTTQALGGSAAHQWLNGQIPWWDPFSGIGMPLAAEMQSSALFLPYVLLLALPSGVILLGFAMQWTAGLATWRLLRRLELSETAAVVGAVCFELCASFAWVGAPMNLPVAFLPLFLLGIERARAAVLEGKTGGWRTIALAVAWSLYAGFPETAYLDGLLALVWAIVRFAALPGLRQGFALRVIAGGAIGLLLAAPVLWPFASLLPVASLGQRQGFSMSLVSIPHEALVQLLTPYALGAPAGLSGLDPTGTLIWLWGRTGGYVGMVLALATLVGTIVPGPNRTMRWVLLAWIVFILSRVTGVPILSQLFHLVPFSDQIQAFRYSAATWLMPCCVLAAHAVERPVGGWRVWLIAAILLLAGATAAWLTWPLARNIPAAPKFLAISLAWGALSLMAAAIVFARQNRRLMIAVLVGDMAVLSMGALMSGQRDTRLDWPAITFLQTHIGLQRFTTLGPFRPNYGALYGVASVNFNYLPSPTIWSDYAMEHLRPGIEPVQFDGSTPGDEPGRPTNAEILTQHLDNYTALGVRYVVAPAGVNPFSEGSSSPAAAPGGVPLTMTSGMEISGSLPPAIRPVTAISVTIGTYGGSATGQLELTLCNAAGCVEAHAPLATAPDNEPLSIPLAHTLEPNGPMTWTLRQPAGRSVAIWRWPDASGQLMPRIMPDYVPAPGEPVRAYGDPIMAIYEIPGAAAYFSTINAPCTVHPLDRTQVDVTCQAPATLVRRELMMPGWRAWVGPDEAAITQSEPLFQSVPLPAGPSHVEFRYRPTGAPWFSAIFVLGLLGLLPWDWWAKRRRRF